MPDDRKVFDIARPTATASSRPVIPAGPPAPDPMVRTDVIDKPSRSIPLSFDDSETAVPAPAPEPVAPVEEPMPSSVPEPTVEPPAPESPSLTEEPQAEITNIAVNQAPPEPIVAEAAPAFESGGEIKPALPGAPESSFASVPKFGELQPKIDSHPLFSGQKDKRVKIRRTSRFVWPLVSLLFIAALGYAAIDSGVVRGSSHLPFHVFKQAATTPAAATITPLTADQTLAAQNSSDQSPPSSDGAPAGFKIYNDSYLSFIYPSTWTINVANEKDLGFVRLTGPDDASISLLDPSTKKPNTAYLNKHLSAEVSFVPSGQASTSRQCMGDKIPVNTCTIYDTSTINIKGATNAKLVLSDFVNLGSANYFTVSDDELAALGAKTFKNGLSVNGKLAIFNADVDYKKTAADTAFSSNGGLADVATFKASDSYRDLVKVFESVVIK